MMNPSSTTTMMMAMATTTTANKDDRFWNEKAGVDEHDCGAESEMAKDVLPSNLTTAATTTSKKKKKMVASSHQELKQIMGAKLKLMNLGQARPEDDDCGNGDNPQDDNNNGDCDNATRTSTAEANNNNETKKIYNRSITRIPVKLVVNTIRRARSRSRDGKSVSSRESSVDDSVGSRASSVDSASRGGNRFRGGRRRPTKRSASRESSCCSGSVDGGNGEIVPDQCILPQDIVVPSDDRAGILKRSPAADSPVGSRRVIRSKSWDARTSSSVGSNAGSSGNNNNNSSCPREELELMLGRRNVYSTNDNPLQALQRKRPQQRSKSPYQHRRRLGMEPPDDADGILKDVGCGSGGTGAATISQQKRRSKSTSSLLRRKL